MKIEDNNYNSKKSQINVLDVLKKVEKELFCGTKNIFNVYKSFD